MKYKHFLIHLCAIFLLSMTSCGSTNFKEYYNKSWKPGENALDTEQPIYKNPVGKYNLLHQMRRTQDQVGLPSQGKANLLVVPLQFTSDDLISAVDVIISDEERMALKDLYFSDQLKEYPSVRSYYATSSFGKFDLSGVVSPVVTLPDAYVNYLLKMSISSKEKVVNEILEYVYQYLFVETETYYIGDFDSDNDHRIDAISLILNYPYEVNFGDDTLTSLHQSFADVNQVYFSNDIENLKTCPVNSFSILPESFRKLHYDGFDSREYIRLIGQMMGLDQYEDKTINPESGTIRAPLAYSDIVSGGIGDHNAFSKYQLGWIEPTCIKASDIKETKTLTIESSITSGDCILLYTGKQSMFGEYLLIDLYSPKEGVNRFDSQVPSIYGQTLWNQEAVRVYQVDARLVQGYGDRYFDCSTTSFDGIATLENGTTPYRYDYAYTNQSVNPYQTSGYQNYALVSLLSKTGSNRHLTYFNTEFTISDLFLQGDSFGDESQIDGFYHNFRFHGFSNDQPELHISFVIDEIKDGKATITFRRTEA